MRPALGRVSLWRPVTSRSRSRSAGRPGRPGTARPPPDCFESPESFFSWVTAFAQSIGATIETIIQRQEPDLRGGRFGGSTFLVQKAPPIMMSPGRRR
jgi:hypothetical protein